WSGLHLHDRRDGRCRWWRSDGQHGPSIGWRGRLGILGRRFRSLSTGASSMKDPRDLADGGRIGLIGLGNMGGRMGRRIVEAGWTVTGYDTRPEAAEELGINPAATVG